ncbi:MAG TPA: type II toxin-antitoxin system VapC family toxin [Steroidobacteraceae bacterium]|nr:type II toxin-antitoxin system VapC family toxin [Steroidobacteraceae bacterium]
MPGLDTNVLVRWILDDDPRQAARVQQLFEEVSEQQLPLFVPSTVMLELEWVLRSRYKFDKSTVLGAFNALLETQELEFQDEPALERALSLYRQASADFADCLHAGQCGSAGRAPMMTFDETAARLPIVELLKA